MTQLGYWSLFGINKKLLIGIIIVNLLIFSSIAYIGLVSYHDQENNPNLSFEGSREAISPSVSDSGDIFWVTTTNTTVNDESQGSEKQAHILHHLDPNFQYSEFVFYNIDKEFDNQYATFEGVINNNIYLQFTPGLSGSFEPNYHFYVKLALNDFDPNSQELDAKIAVIDKKFRFIPRLYESGTILTSRGLSLNTVELFSIDVDDLHYSDITLPIDGNELFENIGNIEQYFDTSITTESDMVSYKFPQFSSIDRFDLDEDDNIIIYGEGKPSYNIISANLEEYDPTDENTMNYTSLPDQTNFQEFVKLFDDGDNFYFVFSNQSQFDYGTIDLD